MPDESNVKSGATPPQGPQVSGSSAQPASQMPPPTITKKTKAAASRVMKGGGPRKALGGMVQLVWSGVGFVFNLIGGLLKFVLWRIPCAIHHAFHRIKSNKLRRAAALGAGLLVGVGVFFLWPTSEESLSALTPKSTARHEATKDDPAHETCEFLARPAAKVFVDGELAAPEVPPIFRTRLEVGKHSIRFVSPDDRTRERTIEVVKGEPTQWFMNFVNDTMDERPLTSELEKK